MRKRIIIITLWLLLTTSLAFAVYTHLTVTDTHTIIERETVEVQIVDTNHIESFVTSFAQVYYSWSEGTEQSAARSEALRNFLTDDLLQLNQSFARDMDASSTVQDVQIWNVERLDDRNFQVLFSVERLIRAIVVDYEEDTIWEPWEQVVQREVLRHLDDVVRSYYTVIVHVDDAGNAVITHNPNIQGLVQNPTPLILANPMLSKLKTS